jgi:hypothetical protein
MEVWLIIQLQRLLALALILLVAMSRLLQIFKNIALLPFLRLPILLPQTTPDKMPQECAYHRGSLVSSQAQWLIKNL